MLKLHSFAFSFFCAVQLLFLQNSSFAQDPPIVVPEQTGALDFPEATPTEKWFQEKVELRNEQFGEKRKFEDRRKLEESRNEMQRERELQNRRAEERQDQERKRWQDEQDRREEYRRRREEQRRRDEERQRRQRF